MNSTDVLSLPCMTAPSPGSSDILSGIPESPPLQDGAVANAVGSIRGNEGGSVAFIVWLIMLL